MAFITPPTAASLQQAAAAQCIAAQDFIHLISVVNSPAAAILAAAQILRADQTAAGIVADATGAVAADVGAAGAVVIKRNHSPYKTGRYQRKHEHSNPDCNYTISLQACFHTKT